MVLKAMNHDQMASVQESMIQPEKIHLAIFRSIFGVKPLVHLLKPIKLTAVKVSAA